ncbi:hypothetical protein P5V15_013220 [Pogonomyrmex californicus]
MPPGGHWHTSADVAHPPSSYDSWETNFTVSPPSVAELPVQLRTSENEKTMQSRRLVLRTCEVLRLPHFLGVRTFRLSKRLLRHFFHRKEFRRKGNAARQDVYRRDDACYFRLAGVREEGERTSRELSKEKKAYIYQLS